MKIIISLILFFSIIFASDIAKLINDIKNTPNANKRVLINQLKIKFRNSNQKQRLEIINSLKQIQHSNSTNHQKYKMKQKNNIHTQNSNSFTNNISKSIQKQKGKTNH